MLLLDLVQRLFTVTPNELILDDFPQELVGEESREWPQADAIFSPS